MTTTRRTIPGTTFTVVPIDDSEERAIYSAAGQYLGIIVKVRGGWGTMDGRDHATQRAAAERLAATWARRAA